ncbi:putative signal transducing protein [Candidatus Lucifugimonas marina]|uniref:DUF2007 domain-containing protein n=1 Tax=Candidatus Lucifugimonas marina TaxID=3038979 RepID=A0AAJ5ZFH0_9CHLR|nr:hypothetical protein [SAR202 cluster bacterium JH702]MDG0870601.1 hypothetical protein [SAR202 cluster bacterium JH639]WFG36549.1 hypothetical protein GKN94_12955 [SAR202 cluster bacterium JH545]WFG40482.1 hypothetical protein GKO48_12990 [SAR202 cluster bacterium JH1073]
MNWEVLTTAPDQLIAESWCGLIRAAGIECRLQPGDAVGFMGVSVFPVRLIVHQADVELAQSVLDSYVAEDESQEDFESGNTEPDDPQSI